MHDEIIFEVEDEYVKFAQENLPKIMEKIMDDQDTKGVPILTDCEVGVSWGKLK